MTDNYHVHTVGNTSLVNYEDAPEDAWDSYIGRESKRNGLPESPHHNPFRLRDYSRQTSIELFTLYFYKRIEDYPSYKMQVKWLENRTLCCWCVPQDCHGMVIQNWITDNKKTDAELETLAKKHTDTDLSPVDKDVQTLVRNAIDKWS